MKFYIALLCLIFTTQHCQLSSFQHDSVVGADTQRKKLYLEDISMTVNDLEVSSNEFNFGDHVSINFWNILGFKEEEGRIYHPAIATIITDEKGKVHISDTTYFSKTFEGPLTASGRVETFLPYSSEKKYIVKVIIWDQIGKGKITHSMPFTVTGNKRINYYERGLSYDFVYFSDPIYQTIINTSTISKEKGLQVFFGGVEGMSEEKGLVFPLLYYDLRDLNNNMLLDEKDYLGYITKDGMDAKAFSQLQDFKIDLSEVSHYGNAYLTVSIYDKLSNKSLQISSFVDLIP